MRSFVVVVSDEFPVERESCMLQVVGSEPTFDLSKRGGFADAAWDMLDPILFAVCCGIAEVEILESHQYVRGIPSLSRPQVVLRKCHLGGSVNQDTALAFLPIALARLVTM